MAERVLILEEAAREGLVDHDHGRRRGIVTIAEYASALAWHLETIEETRGHIIPRSAAVRRTLGERTTFDDEAEPQAAIERQVGTGGRRFHAGNRVYSFQHLIRHPGNAGGLLVSCAGERGLHGEDVVCIEPRRHATQSCECADEQASADQQHHGKSQLGNHQHAARFVCRSPEPDRELPSFSVELRSTRTACSAGASPKRLR